MSASSRRSSRYTPSSRIFCFHSGPLKWSKVELGTALVDSLTMVEDSLVQRETYDGQTVLNAPSRINFQYIYLMGSVEGSDGGVTEGTREVFRDLTARWHPLRDRLDACPGGAQAESSEGVQEKPRGEDSSLFSSKPIRW